MSTVKCVTGPTFTHSQGSRDALAVVVGRPCREDTGLLFFSFQIFFLSEPSHSTDQTFEIQRPILKPRIRIVSTHNQINSKGILVQPQKSEGFLRRIIISVNVSHSSETVGLFNSGKHAVVRETTSALLSCLFRCHYFLLCVSKQISLSLPSPPSTSRLDGALIASRTRGIGRGPEV